MTDSLSVLNAIKFLNPKSDSSYIIYEIIHSVLSLIRCDKSITLIWIPSHHGISGNEKVDYLAKEAIKTGVFLDIPIPFSDLKEKFRRKYKNRHFTWLENYDINKGVYYFTNFYTETMSTWFKHVSYSRLHTSIIIRLRTNHHSLQESLYRKNLIDDPFCKYCNANEETLDHFLWDCPFFERQRNWLCMRMSLYK